MTQHFGPNWSGKDISFILEPDAKGDDLVEVDCETSASMFRFDRIASTLSIALLVSHTELPNLKDLDWFLATILIFPYLPYRRSLWLSAMSEGRRRALFNIRTGTVGILREKEGKVYLQSQYIIFSTQLEMTGTKLTLGIECIFSDVRCQLLPCDGNRVLRYAKVIDLGQVWT